MLSRSPNADEEPRSPVPPSLVEIEGERSLPDSLVAPLRRALGDRGRYYHVQVDGVGRVGEIMVRITGLKGRLPLLFDKTELDPGYVHHVVRTAVEKYDF